MSRDGTQAAMDAEKKELHERDKKNTVSECTLPPALLVRALRGVGH